MKIIDSIKGKEDHINSLFLLNQQLNVEAKKAYKRTDEFLLIKLHASIKSNAIIKQEVVWSLFSFGDSILSLTCGKRQNFLKSADIVKDIFLDRIWPEDMLEENAKVLRACKYVINKITEALIMERIKPSYEQ